ncbi:MAG: translation elongation factor Ts, partial [Betaproteobacteria bacterium]|nr:translation elongation factor Ts [Betaproteobacteria bacterium]
MPEITAGMVKELREKTDAPMMECKKALTEADGDMTKAEEILRVRLGSKASKAATRIAAEGIVAVAIEGGHGVMLEINCETDFVAKNDDFLAFADNVARLILTHPVSTVEEVSALSLGDGTVDSVRAALVGKIGENMTLRRFVKQPAKGRFYSYIHGGAKIGVLLDLEGG